MLFSLPYLPLSFVHQSCRKTGASIRISLSIWMFLLNETFASQTKCILHFVGSGFHLQGEHCWTAAFCHSAIGGAISLGIFKSLKCKGRLASKRRGKPSSCFSKIAVRVSCSCNVSSQRSGLLHLLQICNSSLSPICQDSRPWGPQPRVQWRLLPFVLFQPQLWVSSSSTSSLCSDSAASKCSRSFKINSFAVVQCLQAFEALIQFNICSLGLSSCSRVQMLY